MDVFSGIYFSKADGNSGKYNQKAVKEGISKGSASKHSNEVRKKSNVNKINRSGVDN